MKPVGVPLGPLSFPYYEFGVVTSATTVHDVRAWLARTDDTFGKVPASHQLLRFGSVLSWGGACAAARWLDQHNCALDSDSPSLASLGFDPQTPQVLDCSRTLVSYGYGRCRRERLARGEAESTLKGEFTDWYGTQQQAIFEDEHMRLEPRHTVPDAWNVILELRATIAASAPIIIRPPTKSPPCCALSVRHQTQTLRFGVTRFE